MNGLEGVVTQEPANSGTKVKIQLQDVSKHKASVDPDGTIPMLARMESGAFGAIPEVSFASSTSCPLGTYFKIPNFNSPSLGETGDRGAGTRDDGPR